MKHLGIISISFLWLGLIFMIRKWKGNASMTFSQHAAQTKASRLYFLVLYLIGLPVFALFAYGWFIPFYKMPYIFGVIIAIAIVALFAAAIIPELDGKMTKVHRTAAFFMAVTLIPLNFLIAASPSFPGIVKLVAAFAAAYQIIGVCVLAPRKGHHSMLLPLQASYVVVYHLTILAATYVR